MFKMTATALFSMDPEHERTWRMDMVPWSERNTEAFAGLHNQGKRILLVFDEASAIPDLIWEVAEGASPTKTRRSSGPSSATPLGTRAASAIASPAAGSPTAGRARRLTPAKCP
jgi:hypothetical protein